MEAYEPSEQLKQYMFLFTKLLNAYTSSLEKSIIKNGKLLNAKLMEEHKKFFLEHTRKVLEKNLKEGPHGKPGLWYLDAEPLIETMLKNMNLN